jgi:hypothetical protein
MRYYNPLLLFILLPAMALAQAERSDTSLPRRIKDPFTVMTAGFYLGNKTGTSRSTVSFSPYITFNGRYGYSFHSTIWTKNNKWVIPGDIRTLYYPQYTWGLGDNTRQNEKMKISYKYIRVYQTFFRQIKPSFLIGIGYLMDHHFDIDTNNDSISLERFTGYHYGTTNEKSFSSGLSLNAVYDERQNPAGRSRGMYANVAWRINPSFLGSNATWQSLYVDTRRYISFSRSQENVLALWAFYWTTLSNAVPFLDLPSIGWDPYQQRSGRGINQNRYRGKGLTYFEAEYRRDITRDGLLGFVLFTNMNTISQPFNDDGYSASHIAYGGGIRIKFNKESKTKLAIDYGRSTGYSGVSINLGETF